MLFVLLLTYLLSVLGDKSFVYTKHKIRGMFGKHRRHLFEKELEHIYNGVLHQSNIAKDESKFSMLCHNKKLNVDITISMSITFLEDCK